MKKLSIGLLGSALLLFPVTTFAEEQTTTITAEIPSTYTVTIPAETKPIVVNAELTELGTLKIEGNLDPSKQIKIEAKTLLLANEGDANQTIPYALVDATGTEWQSATWDEADTTAGKELGLSVKIGKAAWDVAKPGKYKGSIIFTSSIINNE